MTLSPFAVAREIGTNLEAGFRQQKDTNVIESILSNSMQSGDPKVLQDSITKILSQVSPERQEMAINVLNNTYDKIEKRQQQERELAGRKQAAEQGGYHPYDPAQVAAAKVKEKQKGKVLEKFYGSPQQTQMQPQQAQITDQPTQGISQAQIQPTQQIQPSQVPIAPQAQQFQNPFAGMSDDQLIVATGSPYEEIKRPAQAELDRRREERKESPETIRQKEYAKGQIQSDIKYNNELQAAHKQHQLKTQTLDRLQQMNKKGVTGKPYEKLLEKLGLIGFTSTGRREFAADVKNLITDIRSILGGQFSNFEFQTILNAYPSADFSPEANAAIIKNLKDFQDIRNHEFIIANDLKKENKGQVPFDFQSQVNERLEKYAQSKVADIKKNTQNIMREQLGIPVGHTILLDQNGEPLAVPDDRVEYALQNGAQML